jgi:hypothetical protein
MGGDNSKVETSSDWNSILQEYKKLQTYEDPRYGEVTVYVHNTVPSQHLLVKKRWINTKDESAEFFEKIYWRSQNSNKNLAG